MKLDDKRSFIISNKTGKIISKKKLRNTKYLKSLKNDDSYKVFAHLSNGVYKTITIKSLLKLMRLRSITIERHFQMEDYDEDGEFIWNSVIYQKTEYDTIESLLSFYISDTIEVDFWKQIQTYDNINVEYLDFKIKYENGKKQKIYHMEFNEDIFKSEKEPLCLKYFGHLKPYYGDLDLKARDEMDTSWKKVKMIFSDGK